VPLLLCACSLVLELGGDAGRDWGRYDRAALASGEAWRLITAHVVHLGWGHLWPNLLALLVIASLFEDVFSAGEWLALSLVAALSIDLGLYVLEPQVDWYVGLSGVLHGIVACGALLLVQRRSAVGWLLAIGIAGKLVYEQTAGPVPFTQASVGGPVITAAHLYGAGAGAAAAAFIAARRRGSRL
jgi:rhomboid family GlyGly-CTERM serine protease